VIRAGGVLSGDLYRPSDSQRKRNVRPPPSREINAKKRVTCMVVSHLVNFVVWEHRTYRPNKSMALKYGVVITTLMAHGFLKSCALARK
jgi:hypothetical protein